MPSVTVTSDIRAIVLEVAASPGQSVVAGQDLVVLESMKMEIPVAAPTAGIVSEVLVAAGDEVDEGRAVATLEVPGA